MANEKANGRASGVPGHGMVRRILEDRPSKDGNAQKAAQEVEGLKGYQLGDCLGKGAFGSVYRALNWGTGETVAIKQVRLADLQKTELKVIMLEIDLLKNLNHPNIVKYHGFVKSVESLYIILEYCENGSLHSICKNFGKFPENLVALYMSQVLQGLLYLHEQGVIHRDIKGANILTTKEGLVKLADFGVATKSNMSESSVVGTPYWMAPEVIELSGATTASDIWSLGCTVIELLDGKPPYHQLQPMPALFRIVNDDHPPLPEGASPAVRDFLMQCFQKDPNLRVSAKKLLKHPWIVNSKKIHSVVSVKPTKYDEAVKSVQQWNEALKSPDNESIRRSSRPNSLSPMPTRKDLSTQLATPAPIKTALNLSKTRQNTDAFRSPDLDSNDNWDDDFATSISPSALQLPHLKPHDNFAGLLSPEKLKSYATFDSIVEDSAYFDTEPSIKESVRPSNVDPLETLRPFTPRKTKAGKNKFTSPNTSSQRLPSHQKHPSLRDVAGRSLAAATNKLASQSNSSSSFTEDAVEDYSDLGADGDDDAFQRKLRAMKSQEDNSFSPKLFHPSDLKNIPKSTQYTRRSGGSLRRYPSGQENLDPSPPRTRSAVEIQKYAEDENEDPEDFLGKDVVLPSADSDSGSDRSTLMMLNSKFASNSWLVDDEDEDDPFAQLEEGFDEMDLEANVARDRYARLCTMVESLVGSLKTSQPDDILADLSEQLMQVLVESPELKNIIISSHGMLPILEILDKCQRKDVILRLLKIVNLIIFDNVEIQENLCFVGGIPIISAFAFKRYSSEIRHEAAAFVRQMYQTSTLTLQMFISCGGLNVLVEFLEEDLETERDLVLIGVNGVWNVFELQGPTPKNDFCRIFSRSSILYPLSLVLNKVLNEKGRLTELIEGRIVNIFLLFSQAENFVKEVVADRMVLIRILKDLKRMSPSHQITMLKFIKNLSMLATTHDALQNSNAIEVLTDLLGSSIDLPQFREISNQVLNIMYNLCRLSKTRQEDAALNGLIPLLQQIVKTEWPLKEFALPILCDMAHSGHVGRKILWQNKGLQFYISLLADKYWQVTALDAILIWLQEETAKVEQHLLAGSFSRAIVGCFNNVEASPDAFENFLDPLQKLLRLSPSVASTLALPDLFSRTAQKLNTKKPVVRLNLLRIIRSICDASEDQGGAGLIQRFGLYDSVERLAESDPAILVREMASELMKLSYSSSRQNYDSTRLRPGTRRSSSAATTPLAATTASTMTPPSQAAIGSGGVSGRSGTPQKLRSAQASAVLFDTQPSRSIFDSSSSTRRSRTASILTPSTFKRMSQDAIGSGERKVRGIGNSSSTNNIVIGWNSGSSAAGSSGGTGANSGGGGSTNPSGKSRLPRTNSTRLSRLSLAGTRKEENITPTHSPAAAAAAGAGLGSRASTGGLLGVGRRRRVTSSGVSTTGSGLRNLER